MEVISEAVMRARGALGNLYFENNATTVVFPDGRPLQDKVNVKRRKTEAKMSATIFNLRSIEQ